MTRFLVLSPEVERQFEQHTRSPFHRLDRAGNRTRPDGRIEVPVDDETWSRLQEHRGPGESDDDLMRRVFAGQTYRKQ